MTNLQWLLLVTNLPGSNQTLRMRIWRALKASGAGSLRDGVYVLPNLDSSRRFFADQAKEIAAGNGSTHVFAFDSDGPVQDAALRLLFDRTEDYARLSTAVDAFKRKATKLKEVDARREFASLTRDSAAVAATDFFPNEARLQVDQALADIDSLLRSRFSPGEPRSVHRKIVRREMKDYQARTWATRKGLWFDRVCSAWLIRRFIDKSAKFLWLQQVKDCPKRTVGFDFDGAAFTHVDGRVSFEVLLISFGLDGDEGLSRLAKMVHYLDVGGLPVPEAAGFAAIMSGARTRNLNDDELTAAIFPVLDHVYASFAASTQ
jgi:hypothetical protein